MAMGAIAAYSPKRSRCAIRQSLAWHSFEQYLAILHLLHLRSCSGIPLNVQLKAQHRLSHSCGSPFGPSTSSFAQEWLRTSGTSAETFPCSVFSCPPCGLHLGLVCMRTKPQLLFRRTSTVFGCNRMSQIGINIHQSICRFCGND